MSPTVTSAGLPGPVAGLVLALAIAIVGYLFGSLPTGYLAGHWLKGIDIREQGSGSTGATNVLRTLGKPAGITVLVIDALKGVAAVVLTRAIVQALTLTEMDLGLGFGWLGAVKAIGLHSLTPIFQANPDLADGYIVVAAMAALLGHSRPVWLGWRGGKSVATGLGVLLAMAWPVGLGAFGAFGLCLLIWRIVSLGSIVAAVSVPVWMILTGQSLPYVGFGLVGAGYVVWRHRANLDRLLKGLEPKIGQKLPVSTSDG